MKNLFPDSSFCFSMIMRAKTRWKEKCSWKENNLLQRCLEVLNSVSSPLHKSLCVDGASEASVLRGIFQKSFWALEAEASSKQDAWRAGKAQAGQKAALQTPCCCLVQMFVQLA